MNSNESPYSGLHQLLLKRLNEDVSSEALLNEISGAFGCDFAVYDCDNRALTFSAGKNKDSGSMPETAGNSMPKEAPAEFEDALKELMASSAKTVVFTLAGRTAAVSKLQSWNGSDRFLFTGFSFAAGKDAALSFCAALCGAVEYLESKGQGLSAVSETYMHDVIARELLIHDQGEGGWFPGFSLPDAAERGLLPHLKPSYMAAILAPAGTGGEHGPLTAAEKHLNEVFQNVYSCISHEQIRAFFYGIGDGNGSLIKRLSSFAEEQGLYACVSTPFDLLTERRSYRRQAMDALELLKKSQAPPCAVKAGDNYEGLMLSAASYRYGTSCFILNELSLLKRHDEEYASSYIETLWQYLKCGRNKQLAAASLFIDRSTLSYRLSKIYAILKRSPDDPAYARLLLVSLAFLKLGGG